MEALYKKRRALKRLFYDVIDRPHAYTNEQYIYTLDILLIMLKNNKKDIEKLRIYNIVNNDW